MTRRKRIALELLGPPFLGALICLAVMSIAGMAQQDAKKETGESRLLALLQMLYVLPLALVYAYVLTGIQSIIYMVILEWRFSRGLDPRSWRSVGLSSLLGFASGAVLALVFGSGSAGLFNAWLLWGALGLTVGFFMGFLIWRWSAGKKNQEALPLEK
jgi:hypothetical protein